MYVSFIVAQCAYLAQLLYEYKSSREGYDYLRANFPRLDYLGYCKRRVEASDLPVSMPVCSLVRFEVCCRRTWSRCLVFTIGAIARLVSLCGELCLFYGLTRCCNSVWRCRSCGSSQLHAPFETRLQKKQLSVITSSSEFLGEACA